MNQILQGVVTGGTGRAGTGTSLNIRGRSTLSLSQQPLIYIDGVLDGLRHGSRGQREVADLIEPNRPDEEPPP